eukprot:TRINITY_DN4468_c0_g1_i1.p1 TRINITY_DN4468_c0_g1~~TRINITY_DN4468_c0_g1_i1.p1  ORF type:complete len:310 (+),score=41.01 TRINITY_DN4468_c0_g1_i1:66-995(+)
MECTNSLLTLENSARTFLDFHFQLRPLQTEQQISEWQDLFFPATRIPSFDDAATQASVTACRLLGFFNHQNQKPLSPQPTLPPLSPVYKSPLSSPNQNISSPTDTFSPKIENLPPTSPSIHTLHSSARQRFRPYPTNICCSPSTPSQQEPNTKYQHSCQEDRPHVCGTCGCAFRNGGSLLVHQRIHTGEKPFVCRKCGDSFRQRAHLDAHRRIHTNEKPFVCEICGYACRNSGSLNTHKSIHTDDKRYSCELCGFASKWKSALNVHRRRHTNEKPFVCGECGFACRQSGVLQTHKQTCHPHSLPSMIEL